MVNVSWNVQVYFATMITFLLPFAFVTSFLALSLFGMAAMYIPLWFGDSIYFNIFWPNFFTSTYTRVSNFGPKSDFKISIQLILESTCTRVYTVINILLTKCYFCSKQLSALPCNDIIACFHQFFCGIWDAKFVLRFYCKSLVWRNFIKTFFNIYDPLGMF